MGIVTDIEMAAPVRSSEQERGDENARCSVSSRSTQHIGDVVAGDAAARAPPKFRTSRRVTALAFCGVAFLLALVMGVAIVTMGDDAVGEEAGAVVGVSAGERQQMNPSPPADPDAEDEAAGVAVVGDASEPEADVSRLPLLTVDVTDIPQEAPTATPATSTPTVAPTAATTPPTRAPTAVPADEADGATLGYGPGTSGDGSEGEDDFWGLGGLRSSGDGIDGGDGDDAFGFGTLFDAIGDVLGLDGSSSSSSGDGDKDGDFWGLVLGSSSSNSSSGDGDDDGDKEEDDDEGGCFDNLVCCLSMGLFC